MKCETCHDLMYLHSMKLTLFLTVWSGLGVVRRTLSLWHRSIVGKKWKKAWLPCMCFVLFGRK